MKTRIISALIASIFLVIALLYYYTIIFNLIIFIIAIIAISEIFNAIFENKHRPLLFLSYTIPFFVIMLNQGSKIAYLSVYIFVYCMLNFIYLLKIHRDTKIETLALFILLNCGISLSLNGAIIMRDYYGDSALFLVLLALSCAWSTDICAYFSGYFLGKHKMSPNISPKKTIEGAIGGIIGNIFMTGILFWLYKTFIAHELAMTDISFMWIVVISVIASGMGILGDLIASVIKRQHNIKDFGNIMPGHGGIVDRFDSIFFTLPTVFFMSGILIFGF